MKRILIIISILTISILFINKSHCQTSQEAAEYMGKIIDPLSETKNETWQYIKAMAHSKGAKRVEKKRQKLLNEIREVRTEINRQHSFYKDDTLKKAIVEYLNLDYTILKEDYGKILDMEAIAEQSYDNMEAYLLAKELASEKLHESFDIVKKAEKDFAAKYNITLIESEEDRMSEKIRKAGEALKYYNTIYLIFFKSYKEDSYVMAALTNKDLNAFVQHNSTLEKFSEEGIAELEKTKSFQGDIRMKRMGIEYLRFLNKESKTTYVSQKDNFMKLDKFDKLDKAYKSKRKKDITNEDIKKFNEAVNEVNEAIKKSNELFNQNYEMKSKLLDKWNDTSDEFLREHS